MQYNSPTSTSHASTGIEIPSFAAEQNESTEHQINKWRQHIEQSDHAMVVFDSNCKPMELNHVLRECLSDATVSRESVQSNATVWRVICETVTNYVQEAVAAGDSSISDVYPVSNMCVAVVGWALRNSKGDFMGAVVKIANLSDQSHRLEKLFDDSESAKSVTCK